MTEYDEEKKYDITEFLKKDYKEWSNTSESYITNPRLKTLPQAHGKEIYKIMDDLKAALPNISPRELRRFLLLLLLLLYIHYYYYYCYIIYRLKI